mgnify:CR=1 FL=1
MFDAKHWCKVHNLLEEPPVEFEYKVGDVVIYKNDYGLLFEMVIIGFSADEVMFGKYGKFIHLVKDTHNGDRSNAYWFPHHPKDIVRKL